MAFTDFSLLFSHLNEEKGEDQTRPEERVQTQQRFNQKYQQLNNPENTLQTERKPVRESNEAQYYCWSLHTLLAVWTQGVSGGFIPHIDSAVEEFSPLNIRGLEIVQPLSTENEGAESRGTLPVHVL